MPELVELLGKSRKQIDGPERELSEAAMKHRLPTDKRLDRMLFEEPRMPTGFPDVVAVYPKATKINYQKSRRHLTTDHVRVMHYLYHSRGTGLTSMANSLARSLSRTQRIVKQLEDAEMVLRRGDHVTPRALTSIFVAKRIVAIEFKISNWMKAIHQAAANTWFASHSYILIKPHRSIVTIKKHASQFGVGVLIFDGSQVVNELAPVEHEIPASYGSWIINEWTLHRINEGGLDDRHS